MKPIDFRGLFQLPAVVYLQIALTTRSITAASCRCTCGRWARRSRRSTAKATTAPRRNGKRRVSAAADRARARRGVRGCSKPPEPPPAAAAPAAPPRRQPRRAARRAAGSPAGARAAAPRSSCWSRRPRARFAAQTDKPVMDQAGLTFGPELLLVRTGQPVEFRNSDDTLHNVHVSHEETRTLGVQRRDSDRRVVHATPSSATASIGSAATSIRRWRRRYSPRPRRSRRSPRATAASRSPTSRAARGGHGVHRRQAAAERRGCEGRVDGGQRRIGGIGGAAARSTPLRSGRTSRRPSNVYSTIST